MNFVKAEIKFSNGYSLYFADITFLSIIKYACKFLKKHQDYGGIVEFNVIY